MADERLDVVILGGGTAGWMAAAALSKYYGNLARIRLVESDRIGTVGVGEATIPQIKILNEALGIDENEFLAETGGSFKLGIEFINWRKRGEAYLHSFGQIGYPLAQVPFQHHWFRHKAGGGTAALWDHCLNAVVAKQNKFGQMQRVGSSPLPGIVYAYHFDASRYALFLRRYAEARGVERIEGEVTGYDLDGGSGDVTALTLEGGPSIAGDLFIDCSGFRALLIGDAVGTDYQDWTHWLPCDRAMPVPSSNSGAPLRPYTQSIAHDAGWQWRIPLQHRTGNGHVYSSAFIDDQTAMDTLLANIEGEALAEPRMLKFTTGRREVFWNRNVVAIGLSSGFLEPLESTSIHLIQSAVSRLVDIFPRKHIHDADRDEYNRQMTLEFERVRDFIILHYHANEREDSEFWRACRAMDVPDTLKAKMEFFKASGRLYTREEDLFDDVNWLQVLVGQGVLPEGYHPLADTLQPAQLEEFLANVRSIIGQAAATLPSHEDYIRRHCAARATS